MSGKISVKELDDDLRLQLATTNTITYYIDGSAGNDNNDGLTTETAFKTIQHAVDMLPKRIDHNVTINVASGTYNEDVVCSGFVGKGFLTINGGSSVTTNAAVTSIVCMYDECFVTIQGLYIVTTTQRALQFVGCARVDINYMNIVTTSTYEAIYATASVVNVMNSVLSNHINVIHSNFGAHVVTAGNTGTGNSICFNAENTSIIYLNGTQPSGTTQYQYNGGSIVDWRGVPNGVLPLTGGTLSGGLLIATPGANPGVSIKMTNDNSMATFYKNKDTSVDLGTVMNDNDASGNYGRFRVRANADLSWLLSTEYRGSGAYKVYGQHNVTKGTANPTGGSDGDIYLQYK